MRTCRNCNRTFTSELEFQLHSDTCGADDLLCRRCGDRFSERESTRDGWHYRCPNEDCDGEGLTEDLVRLEDARVASR